MGFQGFGLGGTRARGPAHEYLGAGETLCEIRRTKSKGQVKFFLELKVLEDSRPFRGQNDDHRAGDEVSWMCNTSGTEAQEEMGKQDLKGALVAVLQSTGNDPRELSEAGWDTVMSNLFPERDREPGQGPADGVRIIACGFRGVNSKTGQISNFVKISFKAVPGQQPRPQIVKGFGVPTGSTPPSGRPSAAPSGRPTAAPPPAARPAQGPTPQQIAEVTQGVTDFKANNWSKGDILGGSEQAVAELRTWALQEVGADAFKKVVNDVYGDIPF